MAMTTTTTTTAEVRLDLIGPTRPTWEPRQILRSVGPRHEHPARLAQPSSPPFDPALVCGCQLWNYGAELARGQHLLLCRSGGARISYGYGTCLSILTR